MASSRDPFTLGKAPANFTPSSPTLGGYIDGIDDALAGGGGGIPETIVDAKGDLIAATAADTVARLAIGTNAFVLTADSAEATGMKWAAAPGAGSGAGGYEEYIVPAGSTGTDFTTAVSAASAAGVGVRLERDVSYNWSNTEPDLTFTGKLHVWAPPGTEVIVGGTAKNASDRRFRLHCSTRWENITFKDSALCFSWEGNTSRIEETEFIGCIAENVGALLYYEIESPPNASFEIGTLRIVDCSADNVANFVRCRMGEGNAGDQVQVDRIDVRNVTVSNCTNSGINLNYDGPPSSAVWPTRSIGTVKNYIFRDCPANTALAFGVNLTAVERAELYNCWFIDNAGNSSTDREMVYTKNLGLKMIGGGIINCGQSDFQGVIGLKGQDTGAGDTTELDEVLIQGVFVKITTNSIADNAVFIQRSNVRIDNCTFICPGLDFGVFSWQSSEEMNNITISNNRVEFDANTSGAGADPQSDGANIIFENNKWYSDASGTHSVIRFRCGSSAGQDITNPQVRGDIFVKRGSGTMTGIDIEPRAGSGNIVNSNIVGCHFVNLNTDVAFSGTTANATGTHRIRNNTTEAGALTVSGTPGGTLDNTNNP